MNQRLKTTIALAVLQLFAMLATAHGLTTPVRRSALTQRSGTRRVRRHAPDTLMPGMWGGEHIRFEVTESGANVEYDCAHETVEGKIVVDSQGRFNVYGLHYEEHGGPVRRGDDVAGYRVRLSGRVGGSLLKLVVTRAGTRKVIGTFALARDREAEVFKCR
ncbi:MAG: hypothetical protein QOH49_3308 [Acidobacteriota bacterium]|nr:hypothetical protein [Acidobacteriota bacterium]